MTDRQTDRRTDGQVFRSFRLVDTAAYNRADKTQPQAIWARWPVHTHSVLHSATQNTPELICRGLIFVSAMTVASPRALCMFNLPLVSAFIFADFHALLKLRTGIAAVLTTLTGFVVGWAEMVIENTQNHKGEGRRYEINRTIKLKEAMYNPSPQLLSTPLHVSLVDIGVEKGGVASQRGGANAPQGLNAKPICSACELNVPLLRTLCIRMH